MQGRIFNPDTMFLRFSVGKATATGVEYELDHGTSGVPMIKSSKTGKTWSIDWEELIRMAIDAGLNEEER